MPPRAFGKYEVLARLATGGAANIFLARQPGAAGFHKLVCLKTLLAERLSDADFVAMFLDEARLAARLNHPNCVQIYDLGRVRGVYYISMEYIFGDTLWNLLTTVTRLRTPLPASHVASIIASACDGLHHAHELKDSNGKPYHLVHRDVSPQNVMVTYEGQTKVVDFGIAKAETGRVPTIAGIVKGKFSYMSPEQITGSSVDRRSDIYSVGIVFFECLASRRLYRGDSPEDIARLILEHRAPRLRDVVPDIPPELDEICAKALARHPSKRYQTALEMGDALRDYLDSIRYNQSASNVARLLEERFGDVVTRRRTVFEAALAGTYSEGELLKALEARAVRNLDLFPDDKDQSSDDFSEETSELSVEGWKDPTAPSDVRNRPLDPASSMHSGVGFRVEIESNRSDVLARLDSGLFPATGSNDYLTLDEADGGASEDLTTIHPDSENQEPRSDRPLPGTGRVAGRVAGGSPAIDSTSVDVFDPNDDRWSEDATKAEGEEFDDQTPFEGIDPEVDSETRNLRRGVAAANHSGNGVRITKNPGPSLQKAFDSSSHTAEELEIPTDEGTPSRPPPSPSPPSLSFPSLSDRQAFEPPKSDPRQDPPKSNPGEVLLFARSTNEVGANLSHGTRPPQIAGARRYTFAALLAAVAFGISFGLVSGLLLARLIFNS